MILSSRQLRKLNFLGSLLLVDFAWQPAAKDHLLGSFGTFLDGFWLPRQF
jgi:hypothetical protein